MDCLYHKICLQEYWSHDSLYEVSFLGVTILKSTIRPCMKYYFLAWAGASSCNLDMLDKLEKWVCGTVRLNKSFYRYSSGRWLSELAELGYPLVILLGSIIFMSLFQDVIRMSVSPVFFLAQLDC